MLIKTVKMLPKLQQKSTTHKCLVKLRRIQNVIKTKKCVVKLKQIKQIEPNLVNNCQQLNKKLNLDNAEEVKVKKKESTASPSKTSVRRSLCKVILRPLSTQEIQNRSLNLLLQPEVIEKGLFLL